MSLDISHSKILNTIQPVTLKSSQTKPLENPVSITSDQSSNSNTAHIAPLQPYEINLSLQHPDYPYQIEKETLLKAFHHDGPYEPLNRTVQTFEKFVAMDWYQAKQKAEQIPDRHYNLKKVAYGLLLRMGHEAQVADLIDELRQDSILGQDPDVITMLHHTHVSLKESLSQA